MFLSNMPTENGCEVSGSFARHESTSRIGSVSCSWHCAGRASTCAYVLECLLPPTRHYDLSDLINLNQTQST